MERVNLYKEAKRLWAIKSEVIVSITPKETHSAPSTSKYKGYRESEGISHVWWDGLAYQPGTKGKTLLWFVCVE